MPKSVAQESTLHQDERAETAGAAAGAKVRNILVYRIGSIGDTMIALPAMHAIRKHFPRARMAFLGNAHVEGHVLAQSVLPAEGLFESWLTYPGGIRRTLPSKDVLQLLLQIRRGKFDTLVYLAPGGRAPLQIWRDLAFFYAAGIRNFIGHKGIYRTPVKVGSAPLPVMEHEADHLLYRLKLSGVSVPLNGEGLMELGLTAGERESTRTWLLEHCGEAFTQKRLIGIGPGSNWPSKIWPEERYAELGERLIKELDAFPLMLGGADDVERNARLLARWGRGANAATRLSVRQSAAALSECRVYVGNDTGIMHLAAAVGTPCVVALSAHDWPEHWYPYGPGHTVLRRAVPCEGCMSKICYHDMQCLKLIEVNQVFDACRRLMKGVPDGVKQVELSELHKI